MVIPYPQLLAQELVYSRYSMTTCGINMQTITQAKRRCLSSGEILNIFKHCGEGLNLGYLKNYYDSVIKIKIIQLKDEHKF